MNEKKKQFVLKDGQVHTAHANRYGQLVDFRPCKISVQVTEDGEIWVQITPEKGVDIKKACLPCNFTLEERSETCTVSNQQITVRARYATNISCDLGYQTIQFETEIRMGLNPLDIERRKQLLQQAEEREERERTERGLRSAEALSGRVIELMKTPNRKYLLRWARRRWYNGLPENLFGIFTPPAELKEIILQIEQQERDARKRAWIQAHPL